MGTVRMRPVYMLRRIRPLVGWHLPAVPERLRILRGLHLAGAPIFPRVTALGEIIILLFRLGDTGFRLGCRAHMAGGLFRSGSDRHSRRFGDS